MVGMTDPVKKCTNCTRGPQPLEEFVGSNGRINNTCRKCREKNKRNDERPERQVYHAQLQKEKGKEYSAAWRERKNAGTSLGCEHNFEQTCQWAESEKTKERLSQWKKLNVHDRIGNYKRTALKKGLEWNLTDEQAEIMLKSECIYCNHIDLTKRLNGIDRLDQQGNYTVENTVPCCWTCNYMKGVMDPKTFIEKCTVISQCTHEFPEVPRQELDLYVKRKNPETN